VDANQKNWTKPGLILTSMLKRVDRPSIPRSKKPKPESFTGGVKRFGLANRHDYAVDQYNAKILTDTVKKQADELKAEIIAGKIIVPDYYKR